MREQLQRFRLATIATLVVAATALLVACGDDDSSTSVGGSSGETTTVAATDVPFVGSPENGVTDNLPEPKHEERTIGLLNPCRATEVCGEMFDAAKEQIEEYGGRAVELDARENPDTQVSQFQQLINEGVDAIAVLPIAAPELLGPVLKQAAQKEIPVLAMDGFPGQRGPLPGFVTDVWQQVDKMRYLEVKAAAETLGEGAKVGLVSFYQPVPVFVFGTERTKYWAKKFGLEIVAETKSKDSSIEGSQVAVAGMLANDPEIVGVLSYIDESAIGAGVAARAAGRDLATFSPCCGTSIGKNAIESGRLTATVAFDNRAYGRQAAKAAYLAAQGAPLPPEVLGGEHLIVTEDNVGELDD